MFKYAPFLLVIIVFSIAFASDQPDVNSIQDPNSSIAQSDINDTNEIEPNNVKTVSSNHTYYDKYANILQSYIEEDGLVDYAVLKRRNRHELNEILRQSQRAL